MKSAFPTIRITDRVAASEAMILEYRESDTATFRLAEAVRLLPVPLGVPYIARQVESTGIFGPEFGPEFE